MSFLAVDSASRSSRGLFLPLPKDLFSDAELCTSSESRSAADSDTPFGVTPDEGLSLDSSASGEPASFSTMFGGQAGEKYAL